MSSCSAPPATIPCQPAVLIGGSGDDTYRPDYTDFTTISDLSGSGDTFVDPISAPGLGSDYRFLIVSDSGNDHIAIANAAGQGILLLDLYGTETGRNVNNIVIGEVLSTILNGSHAIGSTIPFSQFLIDIGIPGTPANPFFAGFISMNDLFGPVDGPAFSQLFDDLNSAAGDIEAFGGGPGDDLVTGDAQNNYLVAGAGDDTISGLAGNDEIDADAGNDEIDAGLGDDTVFGGADNDTFFCGVGGIRWQRLF